MLLPLVNPALLGGAIREVVVETEARREEGCGRPVLRREDAADVAGTRVGGRRPVAIPDGLVVALGATVVGR